MEDKVKSLKLLLLIFISALVAAGCISPELRTARIAINEKDWNRALKALDSEVVRDPQNAEAYYLKGFCYEKLSDWVNLSASYDKSLELSDQFRDQIEQNRLKLYARFVNRGVAALDSADWAKRKAEIGDDEDALAAADRERHAEALANIDTAIIVDPKNIDVYARAAYWAYDGKFYDVALDYSNKVIELEKPEEPEISMREIQMFIHRDRGNSEETVKWAQELMELIDLTKEDTNSYLRAIDILLEAADTLKNDDLAMDVTQKALERLPDNMVLKKNLAVMFARKGEYDQAKKIYEEVLGRDPDDYNANMAIGVILYNNQRWSEAIPYLEKVYNQDPDNEKIIRMLMGSYFNNDQLDKGGEMQKKLKEFEGTE